MCNYYVDNTKDLKKLNLQSGEFILYLSISMSDRATPWMAINHPTGECAHAFYWSGDHPEDAKISIHHYFQATYFHIAYRKSAYVFCLENGNNLLRQISGPDRPFALCNLGGGPLRVDTISGKKFLVPAGELLRLGKQKWEEKRKKQIVLLTLRNDKKFHLCAAHILEDGNWRRLNQVVDKFPPASIRVKDDNGLICRLEQTSHGEAILYPSAEPNSDYDIYLTIADAECVQAPSIGRRDKRDLAYLPTLSPHNVYSVTLLESRLPEDCCKVLLPYALPECTAERTDGCATDFPLSWSN